MCKQAVIGALALALLACRTPQPAVIAAGRDGAPAVNLALGPTAEHAWLATELAWRSNWPAVRLGYRFDDVTLYYSVLYNENSTYDRSGSLVDAQESVRTGVWLR